MKIIISIIILFFPIFVLAQIGAPHLQVEAGTLPGERFYFFEKIGEWFEINILTLSTRAKQQKKLKMADERVAEFRALVLSRDSREEPLAEAISRYKVFLSAAEDMAEKVIILDGIEIALAEQVEEATRAHEAIFLKLLRENEQTASGQINEALIFARLMSNKIFEFMVTKYQFTDSDIAKHQNILKLHIELVESRLDNINDNQRLKQIQDNLDEAQKFQEAGLNVQSYQWIEKAKNTLYSNF